jgi:putative heme-binding domain-containing protein
MVLDGQRKTVFEKRGLPAPNTKLALEVGGSDPEGTVRRAAMAALPSVRGQEGATFKALARFVREGIDRETAVAAVQRIPADLWPKEEARPLLDSLLAYVRNVPSSDRTSPAVTDALQFGDMLASLLPADQARQARRDLGNLGVRVLKLATVPDQMLFDKDRVAVGAGKSAQIVFENNDLMPHNFVVTLPGRLEEVGLLAESQATEPGALERNYVPRTPSVLVSTRLLQPRESQSLLWTAPADPGIYPYVCTYPGHWRRMFGALVVVADLEDYLSDPASYLARHPLPVKDDLLKENRTRKEWTFDELASAVSPLGPGRSFANGKQMFQVANCVACHKMSGVGEEIGPDLTKLDATYTPVEILRHLLDPSLKIDDKYRANIFELHSGKVVTGMVLDENADTVRVIENPLVKAQAVVLNKADIADRAKSPTSIMPKGVLDRLTRDEILDLIAYLASRADEKSPLFKPTPGGHQHGPGGH